jgi:hypothetical protein
MKKIHEAEAQRELKESQDLLDLYVKGTEGGTPRI